MEEKELKKLGIKLQEQRKMLHFEREDVANQIGVHFRTLAKWENGQTDPPSGKLRQLAKILQTTVAELMGEPPPQLQNCYNNNNLENESYLIHHQVITIDRETLHNIQQNIKFLEQLIIQEREEKKVLWDIVMGKEQTRS